MIATDLVTVAATKLLHVHVCASLHKTMTIHWIVDLLFHNGGNSGELLNINLKIEVNIEIHIFIYSVHVKKHTPKTLI